MGRPPTLDRQEIEALFRKYGPLVRRRARSILGSEQEAEDAQQEVFVRVLASIGEFRGESQPSTWLYRITTNLCLNRIRDERRRRERLENEAVAERMEATSGTPPTSDGRVTIRAVLGRLPLELAQIAVYYHVDEMDQEEIAVLVGVSRRTVGYRLEKFRDEAQRILTEGDYTGGDQRDDQGAPQGGHKDDQPVARAGAGRGPKTRGDPA